MRGLIRKFICWMIGHLDVTWDSVPNPSLILLNNKTEAYCLRCYRRSSPMQDMADAFFAESPFQKRMREEQNRSDSILS